jgi:hypothetical protein
LQSLIAQDCQTYECNIYIITYYIVDGSAGCITLERWSHVDRWKKQCMFVFCRAAAKCRFCRHAQTETTDGTEGRAEGREEPKPPWRRTIG